MSAVPGPSSEIVRTNVNPMNDFTFSVKNDSAAATSEERSDSPINFDSSDVGSNQLSYQDLQRKLAETVKLFEETGESKTKLEAEVEKLKNHAFKLREKCQNLENRMFTLSIFISEENIAFYTGFPSYDVFMAAFTYLNSGENAENIKF